MPQKLAMLRLIRLAAQWLNGGKYCGVGICSQNAVSIALVLTRN
jgi:hypothetical protein